MAYHRGHGTTDAAGRQITTFVFRICYDTRSLAEKPHDINGAQRSCPERYRPAIHLCVEACLPELILHFSRLNVHFQSDTH